MKNEKSKDQLGQRLKAVSSDLKLYIEKRIELVLLNIGESVSGWLAASIHRAAGGLLLLLGFCFLLVALAIYLGNLLESRSLGYVAVGVPLLLMGFLFMYLKPKGLFKKLEHLFEAEVIKAIEENGRSEPKKIETIERGRLKVSDE